MNVRDRVVEAAERLARQQPYDRITYADIAAEAGVHWTAVRRHLGDRQTMRDWLRGLQSAHDSPHADTRTRILEAGAAVFAECGYRSASLDKVAAHAGLTKGAVYWHFASKQDLFLAILDHHLKAQTRMLPRQFEQVLRSDEPESALADLLADRCRLPGEDDGRPMLFLEFVLSSREPEVRERLRKVHGLMLDGAAACIGELQRAGRIRSDLDPRDVSLMVDALLKGLVTEWLIDPGRAGGKELFRTVARVLWQGLKP